MSALTCHVVDPGFLLCVTEVKINKNAAVCPTQLRGSPELKVLLARLPAGASYPAQGAFLKGVVISLVVTLIGLHSIT